MSSHPRVRDSRGRFTKSAPATPPPEAPMNYLPESEIKPGLLCVVDMPHWWEDEYGAGGSLRKNSVVYSRSDGQALVRYLAIPKLPPGRGYSGSFRAYLPMQRVDRTTNMYSLFNWKNRVLRTMEPSTAYKLANWSPNSNYYIGTSGCDPEFFAVDEGGDLIPAFQYLPPKLDGDGTPNLAYADGFAGEVTPYAVSCLQTLARGTQRLLVEANTSLHVKFPRAHLTLRNTFIVPPTLMEIASDEQVALGCMPSQNAYNLPPLLFENARLMLLRSAGGHIHFGLTSPPDGQRGAQIATAIRLLDAIVGVACVSLMERFDSPERRQFYGRAGEFRTPQHGLEYRVLSNAWLAHPYIFQLVFTLARRVASIGISEPFNFWEATESEVRETIDQSDVQRARKILMRNERMFFTLLNSLWPSKRRRHAHATLAVFFDGMHTIIKEPDNLEKNWNLRSSQSYDLYTSWRNYVDAVYPVQV